MIRISFYLICLVIFAKHCFCVKYDVKYFEQKVDHFGYANKDTYLQRYFINSDFFNPKNGSIFFYTGNEGDLEMFSNNTGFMWENAQQFSALLVFAEHRYYGKSLPYGVDSYKESKYIGYLSSEQALADFATLISYLRNSIPGAKNSPVIAFGGSYGGMLAAWIRMKYPHLVNGAIASSAPILQLGGLTPCEKYNEIITQDFTEINVNCAKSIKRSWSVIRKYGASESGLKFLSKTFNLCQPLSNITDFYDWLYNTWSYLAMTNYPYPTNYLVPLPGYPIKESCKYLQNADVPEDTLMTNIFKAASVFQNYTGNVKCFDLTHSGGSSLGEVGWSYQACTEMVMPMCQTGKTDMFEPSPWNFTQYSEQCVKQWNVKPDLYSALIMYGGRNITSSSNIIFTNGKLDPWSGGGVLRTLSDTLIAIVMDKAAHHLELRFSNAADPLSVKKARAVMKRWIQKWSLDARRF